MDEDKLFFSHWNHRVIRIKDGDEYYYQIHECHYGEDKKIPHSWTQEPITVGGESIDNLAWVMDQMKSALSKPVLEEVDNKVREIDA